MQRELAEISINSLLKVAPIIVVLLGTLQGFFQFYIKKSHDHMLEAKGKFIALVIFLLIYTLKVLLPIVLVALVYNWIAGAIGGVSFIVR